ncbi:MAG: FkbM family methyltransferase, partial [Caulobacterales bacterium]
MKLTQMLNAEWRRVVKRRIRGLTHADKRSLGIYSTIGAINNLANAAGWRPNTVIDIGANQGSWSLDVAREFPQATYLLIEPQQALEPQLSVACKSIGSNASYHIALLGAEARENVPFNFLGTGSSVLEETSGAKGDVASLVMRTLDDVLSGISFSTPALLKLDVQGYELEILKGAANTLAAAEIVML